MVNFVTKMVKPFSFHKKKIPKIPPSRYWLGKQQVVSAQTGAETS